jgi:hypothetical protein
MISSVVRVLHLEFQPCYNGVPKGELRVVNYDRSHFDIRVIDDRYKIVKIIGTFNQLSKFATDDVNPENSIVSHLTGNDYIVDYNTGDINRLHVIHESAIKLPRILDQIIAAKPVADYDIVEMMKCLTS